MAKNIHNTERRTLHGEKRERVNKNAAQPRKIISSERILIRQLKMT